MPKTGNIEIDFIYNFWKKEVIPPLYLALELTPDDKLDWSPAEKMLSLGNIFMHISEAGAWWIDKKIYDKPYEDSTPGPSLPKDKIKELLDIHWNRLEEFLSRFPEIMKKTYSTTWQGKEYQLKGDWIMMHLLEHDIHHRCQINQYLRILGITPPKI